MSQGLINVNGQQEDGLSHEKVSAVLICLPQLCNLKCGTWGRSGTASACPAQPDSGWSRSGALIPSVGTLSLLFLYYKLMRPACAEFGSSKRGKNPQSRGSHCERLGVFPCLSF